MNNSGGPIDLEDSDDNQSDDQEVVEDTLVEAGVHACSAKGV